MGAEGLGYLIFLTAVFCKGGAFTVNLYKKRICMFYIFCFSALLLCGCGKEKKPGSTNLDGIDISFEENTITYHDGGKETINENYTALFVNGSLIKDADIQWKDGVPMLPADKIKRELNIDTLAENDYTYQVEPLEVKGEIFAGINDIERLLGVTVSYFDNTDVAKPHLLENIPQILISSYPKEVKAFTEAEAIDIVEKQLITAYEKRFGDFNKDGSSQIGDTSDEGAAYRSIISNLAVSAQQDRFYIIPVVFDFWVDKYTGDVFVYYNGLNQTINKFNPESEYALMFAG